MYKIPKDIVDIFKIIENAGFEAYFVGGSVRDIIIGSKPKDWDIATNAKPFEIEKIFNKLEKYKVDGKGKKQGTIAIIQNKNGETVLCEITTFRIDGKYSDGRHPDSVEFSNSLYEDLLRRDFTINAIAMDKNGKIIDPLMGANDIEERMIKAVGDPAARFNEDALRILRGIRFEGELLKYGFKLEQKTEEAIFANKELLSKISKERIQAELNKILLSYGAPSVLRKYQEIIEFFMGFSYQRNYHLISAINSANIITTKDELSRLKIRLAILMCKMSESKVKGTLNDLKYSKKTIEDIIFLISNIDTELFLNEIHARRMLQRMGENRLKMLIEFKICLLSAETVSPKEDSAEAISPRQKIEEIIEYKKIVNKQIDEGACVRRDMLEIDGNDIIKLGVKEGPEVGIILDFVLSEIIEGKILNDRETIIHCIKDFQMVYLD